jgi:hypothetical protein
LWLDGRTSVKLNRAANGGGISLRSVKGLFKQDNCSEVKRTTF